jgi:hypothetical protein
MILNVFAHGLGGPPLAQFAGGGLEYWLIRLIILAAIVAIFALVLKKGFGIDIPQWFWQGVAILAAAALGIFAIRFLMGLA